ncbi:MAG: NMT1/THI5 like protein domain protein [Candidatus Uhrbacteria bacterium GW2011_GWE2_40_58]|nr:MAG: NMT1/THI5 like protein domain protein [Candidatus Uhrbacteria bacterium GW2011_GWF2_40_263]KKR67891.1 MAG: NMT1/THI5 like protein domain protein [Candidatus Uhrbacteria bacterium GW2011_GWE2_40_58]OGL92491.1 MAG: hypothetical protein A2239_01615 [Candidatus Uhrbacteria bacterium RIFOXYA2_FULL_40_9]OGL96860.1 MAG: hypothetical protein A2332_01950 [Candidatus Uhrbacteria bacterium RIFOXYB2_FULL_41_18]HBK34544.1 thiamine biosynthesis protein [Candidatus Uhrbacteria bacterium]
MRKTIITGAVVFVVVLVWIGSCFLYQACREQNIPPLTEVTLELKWQHQAQFAGNYVAVEKGFYKEEGLKVNISPFTYEESPIQAVVSGHADFGIAGSQALLTARAEGLPVKAFAVIYQTIPDCAYALKESGITKPQDFIGKTVGIEQEGSIVWLYAGMMSKLDLDRSQIKEVPIGYDATELLDGTVDVSTGYVINEPHQAIEEGYEVNVILMSDYGMNMYGDVLFTTDEMIENHPELVEAFLRATLKGWEYALFHEEETVEMVLHYATDRTMSHEAYMLRQSAPLIHSGEVPIGWMDAQGWQRVEKILKEENLLDASFSNTDYYTTKFLESIQTERKQ